MLDLIENILKETPIPKNIKRANITGLKYYGNDKRKYGFPIESATLGFVRDYKTGGKIISKFTRLNQELYQLLCDYANQNKIIFESICINHNVRCLPHRDKNNKNLSTIITFGNFTGGRLILENPTGMDFVDTYKNPYTFDGSKIIHYTEPFEGERWSVIFF